LGRLPAQITHGRSGVRYTSVDAHFLAWLTDNGPGYIARFSFYFFHKHHPFNGFIALDNPAGKF
jgi:hypothetical protein